MMEYKPYKELLKRSYDFIVEYKFLTIEEGGRYSGTPFQGYRSDFWYEHNNHDIKGYFMIYPEFLDESGQVITDLSSRVSEKGRAAMWILNDKMQEYHRDRIRVGTTGYFLEGDKKVATCIVTEIGSLIAEPISN
ncbi:hypothetical protein [Telluribacter sp.]|jgi:hypothetical protein|uniref:hypothetical protein n=1 Tax=Telluribacter sp. TaxID=1978767 RepID=UPI002E0F4B12|nr:hypothetical protein [Telluribacter sp.]